MTPAELLDLHDRLTKQARTLMESKNRDYRGGTDDPFANFRGAQFLGIDPIVGIAMRMMDKLQRVRAFATTGTLAVKSESFEDAVVDLINYAVLMAGMAAERTEKGDQNRQRCHGSSEVTTAVPFEMPKPHPLLCREHGGSITDELCNNMFGFICPKCEGVATEEDLE